MAITRFEDLNSWQKTRRIVQDVYRHFGNCKDYSFRDQVQRATISIMNNIAEGFDRKSNKEFSYFIKIALGSCGEVRSMLYVAHDLGYLTPDKVEDLQNRLVEVRSLLIGLSKSLIVKPKI